jgi:transcriptional regulator with XRE-family HTH domain
MTANTRFEEWEAKQLENPEFLAAVEELEPAYQITRLRILRGLTQEQLAEIVGTKQSGIARLESGKSQPRVSFLRRVVEALDGHLEVRITPKEEMDSISGHPIITVVIQPTHAEYVKTTWGKREQRIIHWTDWNPASISQQRISL